MNQAEEHSEQACSRREGTMSGGGIRCECFCEPCENGDHPDIIQTPTSDPKDYAQMWLDGGEDPTFDQIDGFLYRHFNARAVYARAEPGVSEGLLDEMSEDWQSVERAIWPNGPASGTGSGAYAGLKARIIAALASPSSEGEGS